MHKLQILSNAIDEKKEPKLDLAVPVIDEMMPLAYIGVGAELCGSLHVPGEVVINGTFEGNLNASLLTIGETGLVRGYIEADNVHIYGKSVQTLVARNFLHIHATACVMGETVYGSLQVESGAELEGVLKRQ